MKINSYITNQNIKTIKNCILILVLILLTSCASTSIRGTEDFGVRGLEEIPSGFWSDCKSVSVTIHMDKNIHAECAGQSKSTNLFPYGMLAYGLAPFGGVILSPVLSMGVPLAIDAATESSGLDSSEFHRDINNTISKTSYSRKEFLLNCIKPGLTFPSQVQPSYEMANWEGSNCIGCEVNTGMESDAYININVRLFMYPDFEHKDTEPRAQMVIFTSLIVTTKDAMQQQADFFQKRSLPKEKSANMISSEMQHHLSEVQREKIYRGTYLNFIIKKTEFFAHSKWLSDDGNFLKENIKELLQRSLIELTQKIGTA